jgi:hypothetical protein
MHTIYRVMVRYGGGPWEFVAEYDSNTDALEHAKELDRQWTAFGITETTIYEIEEDNT